MSRSPRTPTPTRRPSREERRATSPRSAADREADDSGPFPAHRPPRDWRTVAPLASDIRGRMERPTGE
jgi:hypothetical protein